MSIISYKHQHHQSRQKIDYSINYKTQTYTHSHTKLSIEEQENVRRRFPKDIELSLDNYLPGKVHADIYEVVPVGKKSFLWFTYFNNGHAAFIVTKTQRGYRFDIVNACFIDELAYGTVLCGIFTIRTKHDGTPHSFFCADDVVYYKGRCTKSLNIGQRLSIISDLFEQCEVGNLGPTNNVTTICAPLITNDFTVAQGYLSTLPYPTYGVKMMRINEGCAVGVLPATNKRNDTYNIDARGVFLVRANSDPDSYSLFGKSSNTQDRSLKNIGLALIPSYADSVRMNLLFRNIRENVSIDYIEESDDEDDFENIDPNKYLMEGAEYKMNCYFSNVCHKWVPESVANDDAQLSFVSDAGSYYGSVRKQHTTNGNHIGGNANSNRTGNHKNNLHFNSNKNQNTNNQRRIQTSRPHTFVPCYDKRVDISNYDQSNTLRKPIFSVYGNRHQHSNHVSNTRESPLHCKQYF